MQEYLQFLSDYGPRFFNGAIITVQQTILSSVLAIVMALIMALMKMSTIRALRWIAISYIEFFRGTSLLVQLFWIFYVLPLFGVTLEPFTAGFIAVGLNLGAYGAELVRGGIQAVPKGQYEACVALNLPPVARFRRIIFPQALLKMLPPWGNLLIELLKASALVSLISVSDLMFQSKQINASTFLSAEAFGTALIIYYVMARLVISPSVRHLEMRLSRKLSRG